MLTITITGRPGEKMYEVKAEGDLRRRVVLSSRDDATTEAQKWLDDWSWAEFEQIRGAERLE